MAGGLPGGGSRHVRPSSPEEHPCYPQLLNPAGAGSRYKWIALSNTTLGMLMATVERTPLWAGIAMLPLTVGFLIAGPASGWLSDRFGARPFATGGMVVAALSFVLLELLPVNFEYWQFALILLMNGIGVGLFASPNRAGIMNSLPPDRRGVGAGMSATFQNSAMVLSIGIFFTLIILGLASSLPSSPSRRAWSRRSRRCCAAAGTCTRSTAARRPPPWSRPQPRPATTWKVARLGSSA